MNIEQFRYMSEVARYKSFNQAAMALYISQPSISTSVKKLETEIGEKLFVRHSNGVSLTPFGEQLLPYVRNVLSQFDLMPLQVYGKGQKSRSRLTVCNGGYRFISDALAKVYTDNKVKGIHLDIYDCSREESLSMVSAGTAEVGGFGVFSFQKDQLLRHMNDMKVKFTPIMMAPITASVGPTHPLFDRKEDWVALDMIKDYPLLYTFTEHSNSLIKRLGQIGRASCRERV